MSYPVRPDMLKGDPVTFDLSEDLRKQVRRVFKEEKSSPCGFALEHPFIMSLYEDVQKSVRKNRRLADVGTGYLYGEDKGVVVEVRPNGWLVWYKNDEYRFHEQFDVRLPKMKKQHKSQKFLEAV